MTKVEYYDSLPTLAYYSGLSGIEIKKLENDFDDYVICISGAWGGRKQVHRVKIYNEVESPYFRVHGHKILLEDCIRC